MTALAQSLGNAPELCKQLTGIRVRSAFRALHKIGLVQSHSYGHGNAHPAVADLAVQDTIRDGHFDSLSKFYEQHRPRKSFWFYMLNPFSREIYELLDPQPQEMFLCDALPHVIAEGEQRLCLGAACGSKVRVWEQSLMAFPRQPLRFDIDWMRGRQARKDRLPPPENTCPSLTVGKPSSVP